MNNYLIHHGVKGMKWGVRHDNKNNKRSSLTNKQNKIAKRIAIGAAIVAGTVLVGYGAYKVSEIRKSKEAYKIAKKLVTQKYRKTNIRMAKSIESEETWRALGKDPKSPERYKRIKNIFDDAMKQDASKIEKEARDLGRDYIGAKKYNRKQKIKSLINPYSNMFGGPSLKDDPIKNYKTYLKNDIFINR